MKQQKGFTLIEMILVIALISSLAMVALAVLNPLEQFKKSNDARRKSDLYQIQRALEAYYQDNGKYPTSTSDFQIQSGGKTITWGTSWQPYMNIVPKDPGSPTKFYVYYSPSLANGQTYYIYASLDRGADDPQVCNGGAACANVPSGATCGAVCSFGLSSPNVSP